MTDLIKVYAIDADKMGDDFKCLTCSDDEFIAEATKQNIPPIDIKKFERMFNVSVFDYENFIIRFI
jgi:hypothetical protein